MKKKKGTLVSTPTYTNQWGLITLIALLAGAGTLMLKRQEESS